MLGGMWTSGKSEPVVKTESLGVPGAPPSSKNMGTVSQRSGFSMGRESSIVITPAAKQQLEEAYSGEYGNSVTD
jgi:hypothetical protein